MDSVLKHLTGTEAWVFIDDLIVYPDTVEEYAKGLANVFERFREANLKLQQEKCVFAKDKVTYLGFELSYRGIETSPYKVKAVQKFPVPKSVKDVKSFLGLASFYRRLVPHFADIPKPLTQLTKKDKIWDWNQECQESFNELKSKLSNTPVLAFPDFKVPFILTTDASTVGLVAVLFQVQEGIGKPISFASRQLNKAERAYLASELETLAVVWATKYYRCYLFGKSFLVRTDHAALTFLRNFADNNSRPMRWSLRFFEFNFDIEHVPGSKIKHVDALSRHVGLVEESQLMSKERMIREQKRDAFCRQQVQNCLTANGDYFLDMDGALYKRVEGKQPKLVVPQSLIQDVIAENHGPIFRSHPGSQRFFGLISLKYWWPKMRQSIGVH
jgi:hypothetical protein